MGLRVGVVVVGSPYWDNRPRDKWRQDRLRAGEENVVAVSLPIRYARRSSPTRRRKGTHTMVLYRPGVGDNFGVAKVLPAKRPVEAFEQLLDEAAALWTAEHENAQVGSTQAFWGSVAIHVNPDRDDPLA